MLRAKSWRVGGSVHKISMLQFVFFVHDKLISIYRRMFFSLCPTPQRTAMKYQQVLWIITQIGVEAGDERSCCLRFGRTLKQNQFIFRSSPIISQFFGISFSLPLYLRSTSINSYCDLIHNKSQRLHMLKEVSLIHTAIRSHKICIRIVK